MNKKNKQQLEKVLALVDNMTQTACREIDKKTNDKK